MSASSSRRRPVEVAPQGPRGRRILRRQPRLEEFGDGSSAPDGSTPPEDPRRSAALPGIWASEDGKVRHPMLRPGEIRSLPFQIDLARIGIAEDLLIVLPTGLGKTVIAGLVAAELLRSGPGKLLFLAPTRPLVRQHAEWFERAFQPIRFARFTGSVAHPVREGSWESADAVFATPQLVENDLREGRYDLRDVALLVVDEAHHAVGKYAYVAIAARFRTMRGPSARLLGLTASPGGEDERIDEVVRSLGVARIEARSRDDEGVREYVQPVEIEQRWVDLPEPILAIQSELRSADRAEARRLQKMGYLRRKPIHALSIKDLVALRSEIFARPGPMVRKFGPLFHQLLLLHLHHALERLETQGVGPFLQYLDRVAAKPSPSRGDRAFLKLPEIVDARRRAVRLLEDGASASHPKIDALLELVEAEFGRARDRPPRLLVFAQYRDTILGIEAALRARGRMARRFVGQATRDPSDPGMAQSEQAKVLDAFRDGRFPILIASSVAEEGLDVPDVDVVVFFESIPSEIRAIQRRGRTGRTGAGRVVLLLTSETREEGYQRAEVRREAAMGRIVRRLSKEARARSAGAKAGAASPRPVDPTARGPEVAPSDG